MAQLLDFVQPRKLGLKILPRIALCARRDGTLSQIKSENRQRGNHQHHRGQQFRPETHHAAFACLDRRIHGKSTCSVAPLFRSTLFSRVVLLSIHALSV